MNTNGTEPLQPEMKPSERLAALGHELPELIPPSGAYAHAVREGNLLFLAGKGFGACRGKVGKEVSLLEAQDYARSTTLMLLAVVKKELGSIDRVERFLKITGFVNATPEFSDHPRVMDACSELLGSLFGEAAAHARTSIGVASTPNQIPVEIDAIVAIKAEIVVNR